jgi:hypothetical protein
MTFMPFCFREQKVAVIIAICPGGSPFFLIPLMWKTRIAPHKFLPKLRGQEHKTDIKG